MYTVQSFLLYLCCSLKVTFAQYSVYIAISPVCVCVCVCVCVTQQADAQTGQALSQPVPQALRQLSPPLLLPGVVLLVQGEAVHVPGQAGGQVGDGCQCTWSTQAHRLLHTWIHS